MIHSVDKKGYRKIDCNILVESVLLLMLIAAATPLSLAEAGQEGAFSYECARRLSTASGYPLIIRGVAVQFDPGILRRFYAKRLFEPVWMQDGHILPRVRTLFSEIKQSVQNGLKPEDYLQIPPQLQYILERDASQENVPPADLADLDLIITGIYASFGYDLLYGRVNASHRCRTKCASDRCGKLLGKLHELQDDAQFAALLQGLQPKNPSYERLRVMLNHYRDIAGQGGWPIISAGHRLKAGDQGEQVILLRRRLTLSGDIDGESIPVKEDLYDAVLASAVRRFQKRHAITVTGVVDDKTFRLLNVPVEDEIHLIELNLERLRWIPRDVREPYIIVNMPDFSLKVVQNDEIVMAMRTVIGKPYWHTPSFRGKITFLEINPVWKIPPSILEEEVFPGIRKNPDYVKNKGIKFFRQRGRTLVEVPLNQITWSKAYPKTFPYQVIQSAGPSNPLGRVKFMFPNEFDVYLHDTPTKRLFKRNQRTFSHGCIRIEKPIDLAAYLMERDSSWSREQLMAKIENGKTQQYLLNDPVDIYIAYFTAWVDNDGILQVRPDIYGSDVILDTALRGWKDFRLTVPPE